MKRILIAFLLLSPNAKADCNQKLSELKQTATEMVDFLKRNKDADGIDRMDSNVCQEYGRISAPALRAGRILHSQCREQFQEWNQAPIARELAGLARRPDGLVCKKVELAGFLPPGKNTKIRTADLPTAKPEVFVR